MVSRTYKKDDTGKKADTSNESLWSRGFSSDEDLTKEEVEKVLHWIRQLLSLLFGIVLGLIPVRGWIGIAGYFAMTGAVITIYVGSILDKDVEDYGGVFDLGKENFGTGFSLFLVSWIVTYSAML